jgi:fructose-1,6-bisphosphatase/inositol monophosphatase family enzyme
VVAVTVGVVVKGGVAVGVIEAVFEGSMWTSKKTCESGCG